ncbi:TIGR03557 family F420-dependent LLM class oxidoreductase [Geodermatophilus sp. YIM 151500]|uniref:TIGR03557 family F420-dependent LLM class oxidoreductase n=1 Tax=Geodermatophilus sp. YIM 151500 TaxID=2984531 RepID=UPI0021E44CB9|nr:TIGR03557 family F420-dependent LLM class oxidoreductase [Geodermatophilus sp. YIM 151500]MCV2488200.1 TIGR03557 family F420-dependent LLM class oxidoreductase [Geodermatophilus sp. YIM 151500]
MQVGYKLATEAFGPAEIVQQTVRAERAGFDFVELSDHFHPWLDNQGHSGFTWSMLGAMAARTERIGLATGVTCPIIRYHPAIVAQAAATVAILSDNRFTLGIGAGERLNEHVVGQGWPAVRIRHRMLREALEIIKLLWQGGYQSYDGQYLQLEDARVFDLPDTPPVIAVATGGEMASTIAAELGDGLFATEPRSDLVEAYTGAGGDGPTYAEVPMAWAPDEDTAAQAALDTTRWALTGWKVMSELPNPVNFDAASSTVKLDDIKQQFSCGPDLDRHVAQAQPYVDAGFDHVVLMNAGPDPDGFLDVCEKELIERVRSLTPSS